MRDTDAVVGHKHDLLWRKRQVLPDLLKRPQTFRPLFVATNVGIPKVEPEALELYPSLNQKLACLLNHIIHVPGGLVVEAGSKKMHDMPRYRDIPTRPDDSSDIRESHGDLLQIRGAERPDHFGPSHQRCPSVLNRFLAVNELELISTVEDASRFEIDLAAHFEAREVDARITSSRMMRHDVHFKDKDGVWLNKNFGVDLVTHFPGQAEEGHRLWRSHLEGCSTVGKSQRGVCKR